MKKLLYIHGLASTRNSNTVWNLRKHVDWEVCAFDVPFDPEQAAGFVREESGKYDMVIGSSLGGFYAQFADRSVPRILINPALHAADSIKRISGYGTYEYFGPREDGVDTFTTTPEYYEGLHELESKLYGDAGFDGWVNEEARANTRVILGRQDETLGEYNWGLVRELYGEDHITYVDMLHQVSEECVRDVIRGML